MKLGLAFSGGGFRATVFHLGVLERLAAENILEDVTFLSTVSGGTLCIGLVYAASDYQWPSSDHLKETVIPHIRDLLTGQDLQRALIWQVFKSPWAVLRSKANRLSALLCQRWGIKACLSEVPDHPRWIINATCFETGKNWRFSSRRMGDYLFGHVFRPEIPLSDAMAASAACPALIGPFVLDTTAYSWEKYENGSMIETEPVAPALKKLHLWDGGLYDNLGIEALFKPNIGNRDGVDFLIVSDACARPGVQHYRWKWRAPLRLISIATDQIRSVRARSVVNHFSQHDFSGSYLQIGNSGAYILEQAGRKAEIQALCSDSLTDENVRLAKEMGTTIRRLSQTEFDRLCRHGYEVADFTLHTYHPDRFQFIGHRCR